MKTLKKSAILFLLLVIIAGTAACGKDGEPTGTETVAEPTTQAGPKSVEGYDDAIVVAADTSPEEWKAKAQYVCAGGELPAELRNSIRQGNVKYKFAPGEYRIDGGARHIIAGSGTEITGAYEITQPDVLQEMIYPDPVYMAVFKTTAELLSEESCKEDQFGIFGISGAQNVKISNIAISGYAIMKIDNSKTSVVSNVLVHNYRGTYPDGEWCNMGYGRAMGSIWLTGSNTGIELLNCQVQCSSHHGIDLHSPMSSNSPSPVIAKDIHLAGCRVLYGGCGMLRGETESYYPEAAKSVPETGGYGYYDWSVAFDLCEEQNVQNMLVEDCYALEGWKTGFYTEPEATGGPITDLKLIRCRSDYAGKRAMIPNSKNRETIIKEGECANFFLQGGYLEDCISVGATKAGYLLNPNRPAANASGDGQIKMVNCGDMGSYISLVTEMFDSKGLHTEGFWSLNAEEQAMWLFGTSDFKLKDTVILASNQTKSPIFIGYMLRTAFRGSRDFNNRANNRKGGKYDVLRADFASSSISGTVYNLPEGIPMAEIISGATFNGATDPTSAPSEITLTRDNTNVINVEDYVK